jgi:Predicted membrane protein (DUF2306)
VVTESARTHVPKFEPAFEIPSRPSLALRWSGGALVAVTWLSAAIFGAYILAHYGGAVARDRLADWNSQLPRLYEHGALLANLGIGLHFVAGGVLLILGPLQLFAAIRARTPAIHRWVGRLYIAAALGAGVGGLVYIACKGTVGGPPMSLAFAGYGALVVICALAALRHARARRDDAHRAWALRLFALAVGSWLYRMDYGFWALFMGGAGHTPTFDGPFDVVMDFWFYLPNLAVAELFIRARGRSASPLMRGLAVAALTGATLFLTLATYFFTRYQWVPAIASRFTT